MPERIRVVLATRNAHKVREISEALGLAEIELVGLDSFAALPEVVEDGVTFEANAVKKAVTAAAGTGMRALADDSGLVVDALDGEPGVRSARFAGPRADDAANRALLLRRLRGVEAARRSARFVCVLALATADGGVEVVEGRCEGILLDAERGTRGFGYDPLFVARGETRTFAEMEGEEKARISHRGRALAAMRPLLRALAAAAALGRRP
ncbi:MAG: XTP/dITP diphosphatase [Candidatus Eiseniibacteriota bacterium]